MGKSADVNSIVNIIKEIVKGYYGVIYRDTNSYIIKKFIKEEFLNIFDEGQWKVEKEGDVARFLLIDDSTDALATDSNILKTFNAYEVDGGIRIARISVVCDWSTYQLAFGEINPSEVVKMAQSEKK